MASNNTISHGDMHIALSQLAHGSISLAKSMEALHSLALAAITHSRDPTKHEDVLKNLAAKLKSIQDEQKRVYEVSPACLSSTGYLY